MHPFALVALLPVVNVPGALMEQEARAPPSDIRRAFPDVDTVIPANGRLVLFGGGVDEVTFVRTRGDGAEDLLPHVVLPVDSFELAHIVTLPELAVGATLVVSARCDSCSFSGTWTVGAADEEAPVFDDGPRVVDVLPLFPSVPFAPAVAFSVQVRLPGARDTQSPIVIELRGDEVNRFDSGVFGPGQPITIFVQLPIGPARTVCFEAVAVDAAGNEGALDQELCAELVPPGVGCAQASPSTNALMLLALLLLLVAPRPQLRWCIARQFRL